MEIRGYNKQLNNLFIINYLLLLIIYYIILIIDEKVEELVVAYNDRLTRFEFELFEDLIK